MDKFNDYSEDGFLYDSNSDYDYYERDTFERYEGTYAQDEAGWSD